MLRQIARSWVVVLVATASLAQANLQTTSPASSSDPEIEKRVDSILGQMTLEQKIDLLGGIKSFYIRGYQDLGLPEQKTA